MLYAEVTGRGPRLVLVHGFTQNRLVWGPVAPDLARDHEVVTVDAPGHGRSASVRADLWEGSRLVGESGGRAAYLGYSMGARLVLHLALARPDLVTALVLVGVDPGIEDPEERQRRRDIDAARAAEVERDGVGPFVERWLAGPLFAGLTAHDAGVEARLENSAAGLASSLRLAGTGSQEPLWSRLGDLRIPVLLVAGERDEKFAGLAARAAAVIGPGAAVALVPGAGHAAHLERPVPFLADVRAFLGGAGGADGADGADGEDGADGAAGPG